MSEVKNRLYPGPDPTNPPLKKPNPYMSKIPGTGSTP